MLKYCRDKWVENEKHLEEVIRNSTDHNHWNYGNLVELIVKELFNYANESKSYIPFPVWATEEGDIVEIDHGDYQGTLLFLIHEDTYQPDSHQYLIGSVWYGSCSCCDTLQGIQSEGSYDELPTDKQVQDYMTLCRHIVTSFKKPFPGGFHEDLFEEVIY